MQKTLAIDGVEWLAADFTFDQDGKDLAITNRTQLWAGSSGVWKGGVVAHTSGLTVSVSGTLEFHALGERGVIVTPSAQTAADGHTNYVIAVYGTTSDTPAAYYAGGSPPNLHVHDAPAVIIRFSGPAIEGNGEVDLATVVASGGTVTAVTDTRRFLPYVDAAGQNLVVGEGFKLDGVDVSDDLCLTTTLGGAWAHDMFIGTGSEGVAGVIDDSDFVGPTLFHMFQPTRQGDLYSTIMNLRLCNRFTLDFHSDTVQSVTVTLAVWDDTIRLKAGPLAGVSILFSATAAGNNHAETFSTVVGNNRIQIYQANPSDDLGCCIVQCGVLAQSGIRFTG